MDLRRCKQCLIAITEAASGIGLATVKLLASRGAIISLADINEAATKPATEPLAGSDKHKHTVVNVKSTVERLGKPDGAVNIARVITPAKQLPKKTDNNWDFNFAVNTRGVFFCLGAQLKTMTAGGAIVSAASTFGQMGSPGIAPYCASKAAVIGLTRTATKENQHIRVSCVSPDLICVKANIRYMGSVSTLLSAGENPEDVKCGLQATVQKQRAEHTEIWTVIVCLLSDETSLVTGTAL
ncbi:hypothetical protein BDV23DRAFT_172409 [Aspergillus alliaceus]|uniref:NAD(P)-binding protein n=1 Tax=Petromyces alliaceus TaxID=209559 RepID=A0A5N7C8F5_PETAA|nr:hypothetical protein BDV23DRAFT_172409 [Aspergillus alliaceus]